MKTKIDWQNFNGESFQDLCCKLLAHELTGNLQPNGALGKDQGIDAFYTGTYENDRGTWRFQFKFHNTQASQARSALKRDIKSDIQSNYRDEQHIVFVTNVTLNPKAINELKATAQAALAGKQPIPKIHLWDGAKLEGLLSKHPVLWKGFLGNVGAMLSTPQEKFSDQLRPHPSGFYNFLNPLYGRKNEMQLLKDFLELPESICTIIAPGGYGKTRLAFDFLKSVEEEGNEWKCHVLERNMFDQKDFDLLISGTDKLLLLVDDADKEPLIDSIVGMAKREVYRDKIKLILTVRLSQYAKVEERFSSHESIGTMIKLTPLGQEDAGKIVRPSIQAYLKRKFSIERLPFEDRTLESLEFNITKQARGVPLVLATYCSLLAKYDERKALFNAKDLKFSKIVWELIEQELGLATTKLGITKAEGEAAIQLMALLSPFDEDHFETIIDHLGISESKFKGLIRQLYEGGFISRHDNNLLIFKRPEDSDFQVVRLREGEKFSYAIIPDPYKDIIVAKSLDETRYLTKLVKSEFGTKFYKQLIQNIPLSLDALDEISNDAIKVIHAFAEKIGCPDTTIDLAVQILKDVQTLGGLIPSLGKAAFVQTISHLQRSQEIVGQNLADTTSEKRLLGEMRTLAEDIFLKQVAKPKLNDELFETLLCYSRATASWNLFLSCSKIEWHPFRRRNFDNALFLVQKVKSQLVLGEIDILFGLKYLGWCIGAYSDDTLPDAFSDKGYDYFAPREEDQQVTGVRWQILNFLLNHTRIHPNHQPLILKMCWALLKHLSRYWTTDLFSRYEQLSLGAAKRTEESASKEVDLVFKFLIEVANRNRNSILFRNELWHNLQYLDAVLKWNSFAAHYLQLHEIAEETNTVGEKIVSIYLRQNSHRHENHLSQVVGILRTIKSTDEAVNTIVAYFTAIEQVPSEKRKSIEDTFFVHWHLCKEANFCIEDFYDRTFHSHRELFWKGRGVLLDWLGFGDRPNRNFFLQKAWELVRMDDPRGKLYVLQSYYGLRYENMREVITNEDHAIIDTIISKYLQWIAESPNDEGLLQFHSWIIVGLVRCVYLDIEWVERRGNECYAVFPIDQRESLLHSLYYLHIEIGVSIPFFKQWLIEKCWELDFSAFGSNRNIFEFGLIGLPGAEIFRFLKRHLLYRYETKKKPEHLKWTFLPLDPNSKREGATKFVSSQPAADFESALKWYLFLDLESESILPTDAWHLLRYFKPIDLQPSEIKSLLLTQAPTQNDQIAQAQFFTALMVFYDDDALIFETLKSTNQPFPKSHDLQILRKRFPQESDTRLWVRMVCDYWEYDVPNVGNKMRSLIEHIDFDLSLWLR